MDVALADEEAGGADGAVHRQLAELSSELVLGGLLAGLSE